MEDIIKAIQQHQTSRYKNLMNYYVGESKIKERTMNDPTKPNNKIVSPFAINSIDTVQGYFMGKPVAYSSVDESLHEKIQDILDYNDAQEVDAEHVKQSAIKGVDYEVVFTDENADLRFAQMKAENVIVEYDDKIIPEMTRVIVYYTTDQDVIKVSVYDNTEVVEYDMKNNTLTETNRYKHKFSQIPIIEFSCNSEKMGLFEKAISDIDAYEKANSDTANDMEAFTDAYLALVGMNGTDTDDIQSMKENRVLLLEENGQADFLTKDINDSATENYKNRLKKDIHKMLNIPDLSDENFGGTQSGVSMAYKLWGLENLCSTIERRFKKSLQKRMELICEFLNIKGGNYDYRDISMTFTRNIPDNLLEYADAVTKLRGLYSDKTLLSWNQQIDNPQAELDRRAEEQEGMIDLDIIPLEEEGEE